jgi:hypothetical protein
MRYYLLTALFIAACATPVALGNSTQKAFVAQAQSGQRPDGASHLSTSEIRKVLGIESTNTNNATKKITGGTTQSKEPINPTPP